MPEQSKIYKETKRTKIQNKMIFFLHIDFKMVIIIQYF